MSFLRTVWHNELPCKCMIMDKTCMVCDKQANGVTKCKTNRA